MLVHSYVVVWLFCCSVSFCTCFLSGVQQKIQLPAVTTIAQSLLSSDQQPHVLLSSE